MALSEAFAFLGGGRCPVIAEVGQAHEGSLGTAHSFIDAVSDAGAAAVKFQTHIASAESTRDEPWRVPFSRQDATRYDYWRRMEFTEEQWQGLAEHAAERGIAFLSSPFSAEAVALLSRVGVPGWKIASGEVTDPEVMEPVLATGLPVILSTGMSSLAELDGVVERVRASGVPFALMQTATAYPAPPAVWGLRTMEELAERYDCPVGFSDHSGTVYAGLAACALGAPVVEVHVKMCPSAFGPDVSSSLTFDELRDLVEGTVAIGESLAADAGKDAFADAAAPLREMFGRSWALRRPLPAGTVLTREDLALKKPGSGIPEERVDELVGKRLVRDVEPDRLLASDDVE